jgi:hypothetical protein
MENNQNNNDDRIRLFLDILRNMYEMIKARFPPVKNEDDDEQNELISDEADEHFSYYLQDVLVLLKRNKRSIYIYIENRQKRDPYFDVRPDLYECELLDEKINIIKDILKRFNFSFKAAGYAL